MKTKTSARRASSMDERYRQKAPTRSTFIQQCWENLQPCLADVYCHAPGAVHVFQSILPYRYACPEAFDKLVFHINRLARLFAILTDYRQENQVQYERITHHAAFASAHNEMTEDALIERFTNDPSVQRVPKGRSMVAKRLYREAEEKEKLMNTVEPMLEHELLLRQKVSASAARCAYYHSQVSGHVTQSDRSSPELNLFYFKEHMEGLYGYINLVRKQIHCHSFWDARDVEGWGV